MKKSYILKENEFEALAAKEGIKSCWRFEQKNKVSPAGRAQKNSEKAMPPTRKEEVLTVFHLVSSQLLFYTDHGIALKPKLKEAFDLIKNAQRVVTVESSIPSEQPSCIYLSDNRALMLTVPETGFEEIRLTFYPDSKEIPSEILERYEFVNDSSFSDMEMPEEVPGEEIADQAHAIRWLKLEKRNPDKTEEETDALQEESLLYLEGFSGTELIFREGMRSEAFYYSAGEFRRMLRRLLRLR